MKIKYVWHDNPKKTRVYDTVRGLKGCEGLNHTMHYYPTQEEWDKQELDNFARKKAEGLVLSYEVVEEE